MEIKTLDDLKKFVKDVVGEERAALSEQLAEKTKKEMPDWESRISQSKAEGLPAGDKRGIGLARFVRAIAAAKNDPVKAAEYALEWWPEDTQIHQALASAQYKALEAGSVTAGGVLVPTVVAAEIVELLRAQVLVRSLGARQLPMPAGNLQIRKQTGGATAQYIGEGQPATVSQQTTGMVNLVAKTMVAMTPISNSLLRFADVSVDAFVRDDIVAAIRDREDVAFIRDDGTNATPKGIRNWCPAANVLVAGANDLAGITATLGNLVLALRAANVRFMSPGWMMSPRTEIRLMTLRDTNGNYVFRPEMLAGRLWGYAYGVTTNIPEDLGGGSDSELYLVDFGDAIIGDVGSLLIDASTEATYIESGQLRSAYAQNETVVRVISQHDFGMRHEESIACSADIDWVIT